MNAPAPVPADVHDDASLLHREHYARARRRARVQWPRDPGALIALADAGDALMATLPTTATGRVHSPHATVPVERAVAHILDTLTWHPDDDARHAAGRLDPIWEALYPDHPLRHHNVLSALVLGDGTLHTGGQLDAALAEADRYVLDAEVTLGADHPLHGGAVSADGWCADLPLLDATPLTLGRAELARLEIAPDGRTHLQLAAHTREDNPWRAARELLDALLHTGADGEPTARPLGHVLGARAWWAPSTTPK